MSGREFPATHPDQLFVGRTREIDRLMLVLEQVISNNGRMIMLVGEPGIGKTRTAVEFTKLAEGQDVEVLWGRCYEGEGAPLYWPWIEVIRAYLHNHDAEEVREQMESGVTAIAEMVPHVADHLGELPEMRSLDDPISARFRMFDSATTFLKNATASRPIIIILDDLHWADGPSLLLVEFLAHRLADTKLLVVGTYRDVEVRRTHPLQQTLGDLTREQLFEKLLLRGLEPEAVHRYVQEASGATETDDLSVEVFKRSEGNPLFMSETVRLLVEERELVANRPARGTKGTARIPDGIREVIGRRLSRLSEECNRVLTTASVVGREFGIDILGVLIRDLGDDGLLEILEEAMEVRVVEELPGMYGRYRFNHALTQQTLTEELSMTRRTRLHARIAEALEEAYGEDAESHAIELVEHFANAETVLGSEHLIRYLLLAGEQSLDRYAHEQALGYFKQGLEVKEGSPMDDETADLHFGLARAQAAMGDNDAFDTLQKAFAYYERSNNREKMVALATQPFSTFGSQEYEWFGYACERCLDLVPDDSASARRLHATIVTRRYWRRGNYEEACDAFERCLAAARETDDIELEMRTHASWARVATIAFRFDEAIEQAKKTLEIACELGDLRAEVDALSAIGTSLRRKGDARQYDYYERMVQVAEKLRDRGVLASSDYQAGTAAYGNAEFSRAHRLFTRCAALRSSPLDIRFADVAFETGEIEEGFDYANRVLAHLPEERISAVTASHFAQWAIKTRDHRLLEIVKTWSTQCFGEEGTPEQGQMFAWSARSSLAVATEDRAAAAELYGNRNLTAWAREGTSAGDLSYWRGQLARTAGLYGEAVRSFEAAWKVLHRSESRLHEHWNAFWWAETLLERDNPGDEKKARSLLDETVTATQQLGMVLLETRSREVLGHLQEQTDDARKNVHPDGLTEREVEVLRLVATGMTNKEIGERLYISVKTVNTHVANMFVKADLSNRAEATAYAIRNGLTDES